MSMTKILFVFFAIQMAQFVLAFTEVPPPPTRPERFQSREELKRYLQLVHEYYAIIGRPRFGRAYRSTRSQSNDKHLFNLFDSNGDQSISYEEFQRILGE